MRKDIEAAILERAHRAMKPEALKEVASLQQEIVTSLQQETCDVTKKKKKKKKNMDKNTNNEIPEVDTIENEKKKNMKRCSTEEIEKEDMETTNENELPSESISEEQTPKKKIKPEDAEEAGKIFESCDQESEKKKKIRRGKRKEKEGKTKERKEEMKEKNREKKAKVINEQGVKRAEASLIYLQKWDTDRVNWKFEKLHQVWLLQKCLNIDRFPDSDFSAFLRYIAGMRGRAREEEIKTMNTVLSQHKEWLAIKEKTGKSDLELQEDLKRNVTTPRMIERAQQILELLTKE